MARVNPWAERADQFRQMVEAGMTFAEIGAHFGCRAGTINMACWRLGIRVSAAVKSARTSAAKKLQWQDEKYRRRMTDAAREYYHAGGGERMRLNNSGKGARLKWLPEEYREQYFELTYRKHFRAAEARRVVEMDMARDERRRVAAEAATVAAQAAAARAYDRSFSGQLERAARIGVSERWVAPQREYDFSLTGGSL